MHLATYPGSPIVTAYDEGTKDVRPVTPHTIATSLAIGNPAAGYYALNTIEETQGSATAVSDEEVVDSMLLLAQTEGIFGETAGGVTIASLRRLVKQGKINHDDLTVAYITGSGLKTQEAVEKVVQPLHVEPTL